MNKILLLTIGCLLAQQCLAEEQKIMIISDPHVLCDTLIDTQSAAFQKLISSEPKLAEHSQELLDSALMRMESDTPDLLLIPGDLTYNGSLASHQIVSNRLNALVESGTKVLVIPGNHDVDNPLSYRYTGDERTRIDNIDAETFATMYNLCGYGDAVMRAEDHLSYLAYPLPDLAIICIDSTEPNDNKQCHSAGGINEERMAWIETAAARAHEDGRAVIAMMHHQLVEHFDSQADLAPTYVANTDEAYIDRTELHERMNNAGIEVVLTGHFHINSIQRATDIDGTLYDISTGALCSYASPLRICTLDNGLLTVVTEQIPLYHEVEKERAEIVARQVVERGASMLYPKLESYTQSLPSMVLGMVNLPNDQSQLSDDLYTYMGPVGLKIYNALCKGDEHLNNPDALCDEVEQAFYNYILYMCKGSQMVAVLLVNALGETYTTYHDLCMNLVKSIAYNYVGTDENVVPDNTISYRIAPEKSQEDEGICVITAPADSQTQVYDLHGRPAVNEIGNTFIIDHKLVMHQ